MSHKTTTTMNCIIFLSLTATTFANTLRQQGGYTFSNPSTPFGPAGASQSPGGPGVIGQNIQNDFSASVVPNLGEDLQRGFAGGSSVSCREGDVMNVNGNCVRPEITKNVYVFSPPRMEHTQYERVVAPPPKLQYNIMFIRSPEEPEDQQPVVIPPPQQKTIVYVLNKNSEKGLQMIEVPSSTAHTPEVFYVNYKEGDNPQLPIGIDLQSALSAAVNQQGQRVVDEFSGNVAGGGFASTGFSAATPASGDSYGFPGLGSGAGKFSGSAGEQFSRGEIFNGGITGGAFAGSVGNGGIIRTDGSTFGRGQFNSQSANPGSPSSFYQIPSGR